MTTNEYVRWLAMRTDVLWALGRHDESRDHARQCVALAIEAHGPEHPDAVRCSTAAAR